MSIWNKAGQRLQSSSRCIQSVRFYADTPNSAPHPPFDLSKFLPSPVVATTLPLGAPSDKHKTQESFSLIERLKKLEPVDPANKKTKRKPPPKSFNSLPGAVPYAKKKPSGTSSVNLQPPSPTLTKKRSKKKKASRPSSALDTLPLSESWKSAEWKSDWGDDSKSFLRLFLTSAWSNLFNYQELQPPPDSVHPESSKHLPPHIISPLAYSRRIEGLLEPSDQAALEDLKPVSPHRPIAKLTHGLDRVLFK